MEELLLTALAELVNNNNDAIAELGYQPIRTIDRFRGQTTNPQQFEYYPTPAIFMAHRTTWRKEGKRYVGSTTIDFHLLHDEPMNTAQYFTNKDEALKQAGYYKIVQRLLDELTTTATTKLVRSADTTIDTGVACYKVLTYTCETYDIITDNILIGDNLEVEIVNKQLVKKL